MKATLQRESAVFEPFGLTLRVTNHPSDRRWFFATKFKELKVAVSPDGTESLTHVSFETSSYIRNAPEYRKVLPEAPLERVEGIARVTFPHPGGSVRKSRSSTPTCR